MPGHLPATQTRVCAALLLTLTLTLGCQPSPGPASAPTTSDQGGRARAPSASPLTPERDADAAQRVGAAQSRAALISAGAGLSPAPRRASAPLPHFPAFGDEQPYDIDALETSYTRDISGSGPLLATIETGAGAIRCRLYEERAPELVDNFVGLARGLKPWRDPETGEVTRRPFYDGLLIHRVEPGFLIQGGDPTGRGMGGPGFSVEPTFAPGLRHNQAGVLSMAMAHARGAGSQFFITLRAAPELDARYPVFGLCADLEVVRAIADVATEPPGHRPVKDVVIERVTFSRLAAEE